MRGLILAVVLGAAAPAFGAEDPVSVVDEAAAGPAAEEVASESEPMRAEAATAGTSELAEPAPAQTPLSADAVARATFATAIDQREPADSITSLGTDRDRVYYFTELVGITGREVTHRWKHDGEVMAEVKVAVGGPRWRAYSSKQLLPSQVGEWTVSVIDESGGVLREDSFVYEEATPEPPVAASETTPAPPAATSAEPAPTRAVPPAGEALDEAPASPAPTQR